MEGETGDWGGTAEKDHTRHWAPMWETLLHPAYKSFNLTQQVKIYDPYAVGTGST